METEMAFHIRDPETDASVRKLARKTGLSMTEAVRIAADEKLARIEQAEAQAADQRPLRERVRDIHERVAARGRTGLKADKAFYDSLYED
jgi:antitoxin VapB